MKPEIFFDVTELLISSSGNKKQYYGIARVAHEIAREATQINGSIRFVVFCFPKKSFYEISILKSEDGRLDFFIPRNIKIKWTRSYFGNNIFLEKLFKFINRRTLKRNQSNWSMHAKEMKEVDLQSGILFSAARPKLIVDMIRALHERSSPATIVPLLHDFMPLHPYATKRFVKIDRNFLRDNQFLLANCEKVITNSRFTARDLDSFVSKGWLPAPQRPVEVVQLVHECPEGLDPPEATIPDEPFLLTVALNLGRKNIEVILDALRLLKARGGRVPHLVIAGSERKRIRKHTRRPEFRDIQSNLVFINSPNQTDLVRLYRSALALVMPSRLEGWGLPAGEALWNGLPVICSTAEALKEVCGDLAVYFEPDDVSGLADIIDSIANHETLRRNLRQRILDAKTDFRTWRIVAREVVSIIEEEVSKRSVVPS